MSTAPVSAAPAAPAAVPQNTFVNDINQTLGVASTLGAIAAASGNPIAMGIAGLVNAAGTVATAVEAQSPHQTAIADIGNGVQALASTPLVQGNPEAAALVSTAASFFAWLKSEFSKL